MIILNTFLAMVGSVILFLLPLTGAMYDFQTDLRTDTFTVATAVGVTAANVTLHDEIYDDDTSTLSVTSDDSDDSPLYNTYDNSTRVVNFTGLSANVTRTLTVAYDVDALEGSDAINTLTNRLAWIWLIMVIGFAPAALAALIISIRRGG